MKILMISGLYPTTRLPQYGIFVKEMSDALIKYHDIEIDIIVPLHKEGRFEKIKMENGINVYYLPYVHLPFAFNLFVAGRFLSKKIEVLLKNKINDYNIFHGHGTLPEGHAAMLLARKYKKKSVVQVHGLDVYFRLNINNLFLAQFNRIMCHKIYNNVDLVLGVSNKVGDMIKKENIKIFPVTLYNGYNPKIFFEKKHKKVSKFKIICVGNLIPIKGVEYLIDALYIVKNAGYEFECHIFGRGLLLEKLKNKCKAYNLQKKVFFEGYRPIREISIAMQESDLFVLPSYFEALGCVYLEAMACGIPVIACKNQGISEIIRDGKNGILVEERNSAMIADKIIDLIKNPQIYAALQKEGLKTVKNYTWEKNSNQLYILYQEILREK